MIRLLGVLLALLVTGCVKIEPHDYGPKFVCDEEHIWYQDFSTGTGDMLLPMEECDRGHYERDANRSTAPE